MKSCDSIRRNKILIQKIFKRLIEWFTEPQKVCRKSLYFEALDELKAAYNHFDEADPEFIEAAIYEVLAAEAKVKAMENNLMIKRSVYNDF